MRVRLPSLSLATKPLALPTCAFAFAFAIQAVGCNKPAPAVTFDAAPPPAVTSAAPAVLVPMDEMDAGVADSAPPPAPAHHPGSTLSVNQARAKQCCNALKSQAGTDPILAGLVAQCNTIAMQMGPSAGGEAPEFAPLRQLLKAKNMPAICQGL
jgi:hypothetical protein